MKDLYKISLILLFLVACQQEQGIEPTIDDLQSNAIQEEERYQLKATIDVFDFKSERVTVDWEEGIVKLSANNKMGDRIDLQFPGFTVGEFSAQSDSLVIIEYTDETGRFYTSDILKPASDAKITVSGFDTLNNTFNGSFSATVYDLNSGQPQRVENRSLVHSGVLRKVPYIQ